MKRKYNEIFKLKDMLESAKIPFDFSELHGGYHIVYPEYGDKCICFVYSYGREKDLLEIQGLMTKKELEETQDTVIGYLTAEDVFQRIEKHWKKVESKFNEECEEDCVVTNWLRTMLVCFVRLAENLHISKINFLVSLMKKLKQYRKKSKRSLEND